LSLLRTHFRPPRPMGSKRRRLGNGGRSGSRITYVYGARESSRSFYQIMCLELMRDVICPCSALRLRYMLPIISPALPDVPTMPPSQMCRTSAVPAAPSPSTSKCSESPIFFDARVVARRDDGWEDMLERTLLCWTSAVVEERRTNC